MVRSFFTYYYYYCVIVMIGLYYILYIIIDMMTIHAPKGHTSISFNNVIKDNWSDFIMFVSGSGFNTLNQYVNHVIYENYKNKRNNVLGGKSLGFIKEIIDYYNDSVIMANNKVSSFSDGQVLDQYKMISDWKTFWIKEIKKRGMKV